LGCRDIFDDRIFIKFGRYFMKSPISTAIAIATAIIVIIGVLFPASPFNMIKTILLDWVVSIAAVAALIAIFNLIQVHGKKLGKKEERDFYSLFFLLSFFIVFLIGIFLGSENFIYKNLTSSIIISVESSLFALLAFSLGIACFKLFINKNNLIGIVFGISTIVFLIILSGAFSFGSNIGIINDLNHFINQIPIAGIRGILIGISLGSIATGVRVLMGVDRPYRG